MQNQHLLQEILEDREEIGPRLVLADWLEEQGDPRSEFIRTQCELATPDLTRDQRESLLERESALMAQYGAVWVAPLLEAGIALKNISFRLGDVDCLKLDRDDFRELFAELPRLAPTCRRLTLEYFDDAFLNLFLDTPIPESFAHFSFTGALEETDLSPLVDHLCRNPIRALSFHLSHPEGETLLDLLGQTDGFPELIALDLENKAGSKRNESRLTGLLTNHRLMRQLVWLNLGFNRLRKLEIIELIHCRNFARLKNLRLMGNSIDEFTLQLVTSHFGEVCDLARLNMRFNAGPSQSQSRD